MPIRSIRSHSFASRVGAGTFLRLSAVALMFALLPARAEAATLSAPYGLTATAVSGTQIALSWFDASTNEGGFGVERSLDGSNFSEIATTGANETTYTDGGLSSGVRYYYRVRALGKGNSVSGYSNTASAMTGDTTAPSVPTGLAGVAANCGQVILGWNASTDTGGSGLGGYNVYVWQNGTWTFVDLVTTTSASLSGLAASTTYYYAVAAVDNAGNVSALSGWVAVSTPACTVSLPAAPTGLAASAVSCGQIDLTWNASTGASSYMLYVWQNGAWTPSKQVTTTYTSVTGLAASTTYYYAVAALNSAGTSALSGWVGATTPGCATSTTTTTSSSSTTTTLASGTTPPTPTGLTAAAASCSQVNLSWNASSGATAYRVYIWQNASWVTLTQVVTTSAASTGLAGSTTYYYEVAALNSAGASAPSAWVAATTPACATSTTTTSTSTTTTTTTLGCGDTIAPTVPTGLGATATSCSQIHLGWSASSDSSGIAPRYYVYRNNGTSPIATVSTLAYDDAGLAASTSYSYNVAAVDGCGNVSGKSVTVVANTPACSTGGTGQYRWQRSFGSSSEDVGRGVAIDGNGNVVMVGTFAGSVDFGGGGLSTGGGGLVVAKYSSTGAHLWSRAIAIGGFTQPAGVAVDGSGNVFVAGRFYSTVDFGGGARTSAGDADIFLVKYAASGAYVWDRVFGGVYSDLGTAVAADASGNVLLGAMMADTIDFGGGPISTKCALVKLSAAGSHVWSRGDMCPESLAADGSGNVIAAGEFSTTTTVGSTTLTPVGSYDIYVAKFSATGAALWARSGGGTGSDVNPSVAVDGGGNVFVTGEFVGTASVAGRTLISAGGKDIFLAKYGANGSPLWAEGFGGPDDEAAAGLAADGSGNVILAGTFQSSADFGGAQALVSSGYKDIVLAKYGSAGNYVWAHSYGNNFFSEASAGVAVDRASGNVTVVGLFPYLVDFGGGPMRSAGQDDIFLASVGP
jgi:fibronectin type 3 domain-containing protein